MLTVTDSAASPATLTSKYDMCGKSDADLISLGLRLITVVTGFALGSQCPARSSEQMLQLLPPVVYLLRNLR